METGEEMSNIFQTKDGGWRGRCPECGLTSGLKETSHGALVWLSRHYEDYHGGESK